MICVLSLLVQIQRFGLTETLSSYIGESFVQMPEDLFKKIKEVVSLSNTPRPGKFVYKLMFLKFSRLIF